MKIFSTNLSHYENIWCLRGVKVVSREFLTLVNRLFTAVLLVALLFACQKMPESSNLNEIPLTNE